MRQGITTKYLGPTNTQGSRIKATARKASSLGSAMALTKPYGYGNTEEEHTEAAKLLATKLGWAGLWVGGGNASEDGFHYVNTGVTRDAATDLILTEGMGREGADWFYVAREAVS